MIIDLKVINTISKFHQFTYSNLVRILSLGYCFLYVCVRGGGDKLGRLASVSYLPRRGRKASL